MSLRLWPLFALSVLALTLAGCVAKSSPAEPVTAAPKDHVGSKEAGRFIMVSNRAFNPFTGEFGRTFGKVSHWVVPRPMPGKPGWYEMEGRPPDNQGEYFATFQANPTSGEEIAVPYEPKTRFDEKTRETVRFDKAGHEAWRFAEPGRRWRDGAGTWHTDNFRPQAYAMRENVVFMGFDGALVAINDTDGKEIWRVSSGCGRLFAVDEYLLAAIWEKVGERFLMQVRALNYADGAEKFRIPVECDQGAPQLSRSGPYFAANSYSATTLFHPNGWVAFRAQEAMGTMLWRRSDFIASGAESVSCWTEYGALKWAAPFPGGWGAGAQALLPEGDVIACAYCPIAATDVEVCRLDGKTGTRKWTTTCQTYGVIGHSKYRHEVYAEVIDNGLVVVSQQSQCVFVEVLDPETGKQVKRWPLTERLQN